MECSVQAEDGPDGAASRISGNLPLPLPSLTYGGMALNMSWKRARTKDGTACDGLRWAAWHAALSVHHSTASWQIQQWRHNPQQMVNAWTRLESPLLLLPCAGSAPPLSSSAP